MPQVRALDAEQLWASLGNNGKEKQHLENPVHTEHSLEKVLEE